MDIGVELKSKNIIAVNPIQPIAVADEEELNSFQVVKVQPEQDIVDTRGHKPRLDSEAKLITDGYEKESNRLQYIQTEKAYKSELDLELTWKDILIKTKPFKKCCSKNVIPEKTLLNNVCGRVKSGECLAIIGSSGAGKTTLLNYLSKKIQTQNLRITGDVRLNSEDISNDKFDLISAYVMQDDVLEATMTPLEILLFTAKLKFDLPLEEIEEKVKNMIDVLHLKKCQNTKIGDNLARGVSGGERKRTSIGVELISDPKVIFLDEPTTGLDSYNAYEVIQLLQTLAKKGKIVIFTIHQPSSEIYLLLNKINIMALGRTIYFGSREKCFDCFESFGIPVPLKYNPFEHFMEMTNVSTVQEEEVLKVFPKLASIENMLERYETYVHTLSDIYESEKDKYTETEKTSPLIVGFTSENKDMFHDRQVELGFFYQYGMLYARNIIITMRNPKVLFLKIAQAIVTGVLMAILFTRLVKDYSGIQDRLGVVLNCIVFTILGTTTSTVLVFAEQNKVFTRERSNRLYSVFAYFLAKVLTEIPVIFISNCLFGLLVYQAAEMNDTYSHKYYSFIAILMYTSIGGTSYAYFIGNLGSHPETLILLNTAFTIPLLLLSGFFAGAENFAPYLIPFKYISLFKYGFQMLTHIEFSELSALNCGNLAAEICSPLQTRFTFLEPFYISVIAVGALISFFYLIAFLLMFFLAKIKV